MSSNVVCSIKSSITYLNKVYQTILRLIRICLVASTVSLLSFFHVHALANIETRQEHFGKMIDIPSLILIIEKEYKIPKNLLWSIARVESNLNPNILNIKGKPMIFNAKEQVLEAVNKYLDEGVRNIDIGLMQINYHYHRKQFDQLEDMLDPEKNIRYAAELLRKLYLKHKIWHRAVRYYHSASKVHHDSYSKKVLLSWLSSL